MRHALPTSGTRRPVNQGSARSLAKAALKELYLETIPTRSKTSSALPLPLKPICW